MPGAGPRAESLPWQRSAACRPGNCPPEHLPVGSEEAVAGVRYVVTCVTTRPLASTRAIQPFHRKPASGDSLRVRRPRWPLEQRLRGVDTNYAESHGLASFQGRPAIQQKIIAPGRAVARRCRAGELTWLRGSLAACFKADWKAESGETSKVCLSLLSARGFGLLDLSFSVDGFPSQRLCGLVAEGS